MVAEAIGREPFSPSAVGQWELGKQIPDLASLGAIAQLGGADPGWLAFGQLCGAGAPPTWLALYPQSPKAGATPETDEIVADVELVERAEDMAAARTARQRRPKGA